jgi:DNA replicative helicase MCM subunit Mcm2 (Cdc46/Mcm family)
MDTITNLPDDVLYKIYCNQCGCYMGTVYSKEEFEDIYLCTKCQYGKRIHMNKLDDFIEFIRTQG